MDFKKVALTLLTSLSLVQASEEKEVFDKKVGFLFGEFFDAINNNPLIRYPNPGESFKLDEKYFDLVPLNLDKDQMVCPQAQLKKDVDPVEMIESILNPKDETIIDCSLATAIAQYYVVWRLKGQDFLNEKFSTFFKENEKYPIDLYPNFFKKENNKTDYSLGEIKYVAISQSPNYDKHPLSTFYAYNLACTEENSQGEKLYKGFGELFKEGAKSLHSILNYMCDQDEAPTTKEEIEILKKVYPDTYEEIIQSTNQPVQCFGDISNEVSRQGLFKQILSNDKVNDYVLSDFLWDKLNMRFSFTK